jgi:hypothetical protein
MPNENVYPLTLSPARARALIAEIARDTSRVIIGDHAQARMEQRGISDVELYRILRCGDVLDDPSRTRHKEWKCKVVMRLKGSRVAGAVTIILHDGNLFVMTVEWEDRR